MKFAETSLEAHDSISSSKEVLYEAILDFVGSCGTYGATSEEVERALNLRRSTASSRVSELLDDGRLVRTGEKRKVSSGRNAFIVVKAALASPLLDKPMRKRMGKYVKELEDTIKRIGEAKSLKEVRAILGISDSDYKAPVLRIENSFFD